jgi:hypothetical protein
VTQLNAIIAVEKGVRSKADKTLTEAYQLKPALLSGLYRTYAPIDPDNGDQLPDESTNPQVQLVDVLADVRRDMGRLFDVTLTKETANTEAKADVVVDGTTVLSDVPVTYLLFLEKKLVDLRTLVSKLPTLDPAEVWSWDRNVGSYATEPAQTVKTKKISKPFVKWAPPSPEYKQEAQVDIVSEDVLVGRWSQRKFSGAIPADDRRAMLDRVDALAEAVKVAREKANSMDVTNQSAGQAVFEYLFAPLDQQAA